jgi:hypothetical protein
MLEAYRSSIGRSRRDLATPALLLDLDVLQRNMATMAGCLPGPARLRPHAKSHKCAQIARMQLEAGAIGLTTATVWEKEDGGRGLHATPDRRRGSYTAASLGGAPDLRRRRQFSLMGGRPGASNPRLLPDDHQSPDAYHVVQGGTVVDIWPILARGPGRGEARV